MQRSDSIPNRLRVLDLGRESLGINPLFDLPYSVPRAGKVSEASTSQYTTRNLEIHDVRILS
jgi:hypothetical protein